MTYVKTIGHGYTIKNLKKKNLLIKISSILASIERIFSGRKRSPKQLKVNTKTSIIVETTSWRALLYPLYSNWKWEKEKTSVPRRE